MHRVRRRDPAQFFPRAAQMLPHHAHGNTQLKRNCAGGKTLSDQLQALPLTQGQMYSYTR